MTPAERLQKKLRNACLKPRTRLNTHEWAHKEVRLDSRFTARPGPYDVEFTPYMKGPHEWFSDPYIREITGCKSRQVGGTTYLGNCMMYAVGEDPGPCLYVTSTLANAQSFSEREWMPRVELSPLLSSLKPDDEDDYKKTEQHFKSCTVKFTGSNSPANLMSRSIRYLFEDEVDTWPTDNDEEAPSLDIVEACTIFYAHIRKVLRVSTPTLVDGAIWQAYLRGSQHKYHVPCPHCDHKFELLFEHLDFNRAKCRNAKGVWDYDLVAQETTLKCPKCNKKIQQREQTAMVAKGDWVQTNFKAPREHISWHISALYSPTISWGVIAKIFLQKCNTPGGLHDFYNHYLGLPFVKRAVSITVTDIERVQNASPDYELFNGDSWVCPAEFKILLMSSDVQQDGFWWGKRGVCEDESSYLIDYGPASSWDDLLSIYERTYKLPSGATIKAYKALVDMGFHAKRMAGVYDFCIKSGGRFMPVQGRSAVHGMFAPIRETVFEHKGHLINGVQIRDDLFKEELYIRRIKERAGPKWYLPRHLDEYYNKQLTDEQLKARKTARGVEVTEWFDSGNNHMGDVEKYLLGAINLVSPFLRVKPPSPSPVREPVTDQPQDYIPRTPREALKMRGARLPNVKLPGS